jgi:hypothetical protein
MGVFLLNKVLTLLLIMSVLNVGKHLFNIINGLRDEIPSKYVISERERFLLGVSISYIITVIFTGINF